MGFGIDKCAIHDKRENHSIKRSSINTAKTIRELEPEEPNKYLGMEEADGVNDKKLKDLV